MRRITEDYVSFETAKLLKEKGFDDIDCECHGWIGRSGKHYSADDTFYDDEELNKAQEDRKDFIPLITLQMAIKWLREVYNVNIEMPYNRFGKNYKYLIIYKPEVLDDIRSLGVFYHYEEAAETAIKYCLKNLI